MAVIVRSGNREARSHAERPWRAPRPQAPIEAERVRVEALISSATPTAEQLSWAATLADVADDPFVNSVAEFLASHEFPASELSWLELPADNELELGQVMAEAGCNR